jgi:segregation and condensation protein B
VTTSEPEATTAESESTDPRAVLSDEISAPDSGTPSSDESTAPEAALLGEISPPDSSAPLSGESTDPRAMLSDVNSALDPGVTSSDGSAAGAALSGEISAPHPSAPLSAESTDPGAVLSDVISAPDSGASSSGESSDSRAALSGEVSTSDSSAVLSNESTDLVSVHRSQISAEQAETEQAAEQAEAEQVRERIEAEEAAEQVEGELAEGEAVEESDLPPLADDADLATALEALLLVVDVPAGEELLATTLDQSVARITEALQRMSADLTERGSGIDLRRVGDGWRFVTRDKYAPYVEKLLLDGQRAKLTRAALETLAVIAYRQPVTRSRVAAVRGVNVDGVIRTLVARGLIAETGTDSETGGILYRTTELFLERLGLSSLEDLPAIAPLLPEVDAIDDV